MLKKKNSTKSITLNSFSEKITINSFKILYNRYSVLFYYLFNGIIMDKLKREQANCVYKDLLHLTVVWRHIRGYPSSGATTHTNSKSSKKNKLLLTYRLNQFKSLFGVKKRNIYPTLIKAEYTNRLWYFVWSSEWLQAASFVKKTLSNKDKKIFFNPAILADNQTNGYTRIGKASKIGKAKKLTKVFTIGVPVFFTRFIYYEKLPNDFFTKLILKEEVNKKKN